MWLSHDMHYVSFPSTCIAEECSKEEVSEQVLLVLVLAICTNGDGDGDGNGNININIILGTVIARPCLNTILDLRVVCDYCLQSSEMRA